MTEIKKIFVNGKEVNPQSLGELPESLRQVLADANNNGVPDMIEGIWNNPMVQKIIEKAGQRDGKVYTSFAELPAEVREPIQQIMSRLSGGTGQAFSVGSSSSAIPPANPINWNALEQPEAPKTISLKVVVLVMAAIIALLLAGWLFLLALKTS